MRDIKFRAWMNPDKVMLNHEELMSIPVTYHDVFEGNSKYPCMQYTGLNDKNGVEIYEGDIVNMFKDYVDKNTFRNMVRTDKFTISYNEKLASFVANPIGGLSPFNIINVEVIGNIYENPELLK